MEIQKQVIQIKLTTFVGFSLQLLCACVQRYLNLNSLLVKRQIDNPSPGAVTQWGELVPSSHKRGELRYAIIRKFRGRNQEFREVISVPDSLGNVYSSCP